MSDKPENPPAFPRLYKDGNEGMTLRDYFANAILAGWMASGIREVDGDNASFYAKNAYQLADAMLKEREK